MLGALEGSEGTKGRYRGREGPERHWGTTGGKELEAGGHWGRRCSGGGAPCIAGDRRAVLGETPVHPPCPGRKTRGGDGGGRQRLGDRPCRGEPQPGERGERSPKQGTITHPRGAAGGSVAPQGQDRGAAGQGVLPGSAAGIRAPLSGSRSTGGEERPGSSGCDAACQWQRRGMQEPL